MKLNQVSQQLISPCSSQNSGITPVFTLIHFSIPQGPSQEDFRLKSSNFSKVIPDVMVRETPEKFRNNSERNSRRNSRIHSVRSHGRIFKWIKKAPEKFRVELFEKLWKTFREDVQVKSRGRDSSWNYKTNPEENLYEKIREELWNESYGETGRNF